MSLKPQPIGPVPELTAFVARAAFPDGNTYTRLRDELGTLYEDRDFAGLFPDRGQPALAPWRPAMVTLMQFLEDLSDRQAAEAIRSRIDWKYALGLLNPPCTTPRARGWFERRPGAANQLRPAGPKRARLDLSLRTVA